jgi:hypothetical protein
MADILQSPVVNKPYGPVAAMVPESHSSPLRTAEREIAQLLTSLAESLSKSCVYFSSENIQHLEAPPETPPLLEDLDARMRGLLAHSETLPTYEKRKNELPETVGDLFAAAGAIHHAYDLFRLLRLVRMPPFGFAPLVRMTDQVILLFNATAAALDQDDPSSARAAMRATIQVRAICEEMQGIVADLSTFLPQKSWKMMKAAADSLMVGTEAVGRVAQRMAGQPLPQTNIAISANRPPVVAPPPKKRPEITLSAMPSKRKRSFTNWLRSLLGKK